MEEERGWTRKEIERLVPEPELIIWDGELVRLQLDEKVWLRDLLQTRLDLETANGLLTEWKSVASDANDKLNLKFEEITRLRGALERIARIQQDVSYSDAIEFNAPDVMRLVGALSNIGHISRESLKEKP